MTIRVRVSDADGGRVALWERHPAHPDGEVFLAGPGVFEVALTPAVETRLSRGVLVRVEEKETEKKPGKTPSAAGEQPPSPAKEQPPKAAEEKTPGAVDEPPAGQVLPAEEPDEDVSVVTRVSGPGAPKSRTQKRPARGGL